MRTFEWTKWMALGCVVAAGGCATETNTPDGRGDQESTYRYVLGFDEESGITRFGGAHEVVVPVERGKAEAIDSPNQPSRLHTALDGEAMGYDPSITSGESDWFVFASNWWAQTNNGIAYRWDGGNQNYSNHSNKDKMSPVEKYDTLFHPGQEVEIAEVEHKNYRDRNDPDADPHTHEAITVVGPATAWELKNHGVYQSWVHPDSWWGHCNGWASYATTDELGFPKRDVYVEYVDGEIIECTEDTTGCILFTKADTEALYSEVYFSDQATFAGRRCNTEPDDMERDEYGRPTDPACRDLNAGSMHVALTGLLSRGAAHLATGEEMRLPFIIDANYDWQVWNFPVHRFEIVSQEEVTRTEAAQLVGDDSDYVWNDQAEKFVRVKTNFWMIDDGVPWSQMKLPADERSVAPRKVTINYVLELASDDTILGGEWIKDPQWSWGEKLIGGDFMWMAVNEVGYGEASDDTGGNNDNPHISKTMLDLVLECQNDASTCAPETEDPEDPQPGPSSCVDNCGGQADDGCYCDELCTQYNDCCDDYEPVCVGGEEEPDADPNSCVDSCGDQAEGGCWCDSLCSEYDDCCTDYENTCS